MSVIHDVDATPPWQLVLTSLLLILLPEALAIALFSSIGVGATVAGFGASETMDMVGNGAACLCALLLALAFVVDVHRRGIVVQIIMALLLAACFVATSALKFIGYPWLLAFALAVFGVYESLQENIGKLWKTMGTPKSQGKNDIKRPWFPKVSCRLPFEQSTDPRLSFFVCFGISIALIANMRVRCFKPSDIAGKRFFESLAFSLLTKMSGCGLWGQHLPWGNMFIWYACFLDLAGFFCGPGGAKNVGDVPVCFLDPVGIFFFGPACFCAGPRDIF